MWDSRDREKRWTQKDWPKRDTLKAGMPNVIHIPIVSRNKIIFLFLHIMLRLIKKFVKALPLDVECFQHLLCKFPGLSYEKIKAKVFDEPQIHMLVCDQTFTQTINVKEKTAWFVVSGCNKEISRK